MRSELTPIINHVNEVIAYVRENLDDQEYDLFLDMLVPESQPKVIEKPKPAKRKKIEHCEVCNYTRRALVHKDQSVKDYHEFQSVQPKSKRAKGMAETLSKSLEAQRRMTTGSDNDADDIENTTCSTCGLAPDANVHHLETWQGYHEFTPGKSHALAAGEGL